MNTSVVVLSATRTPLGSFQGAFAAVPAVRLGAAAIRSAVARAGVDPAEISDCLMGNVLAAGQGQAPARQAAKFGGLPDAVRCATINKVCGSGMQTVLGAAQLIACGLGRVVVAGGMENMSLAPYLLPKARGGFSLGHQVVVDSLIVDGLWDPHGDVHMGNCAEKCATRYEFTREQQDRYAVESFQRANRAQAEGWLAGEITPVETPDAKGKLALVEHDEGPAKVRYEKIPALRPSFQPDGTITAANASSLNDGAAALVLASPSYAVEKNLRPMARVVGFGCHAQDPMWFTTAPVQAAREALADAGWTSDSVDLWEVNEAFAVVPMAFSRDMNVPLEKINVYGGAISLGHPLGASGARILVTLIAALRQRGLRRGLAAICIGGGEGLAACVEIC